MRVLYASLLIVAIVGLLQGGMFCSFAYHLDSLGSAMSILGGVLLGFTCFAAVEGYR